MTSAIMTSSHGVQNSHVVTSPQSMEDDIAKSLELVSRLQSLGEEISPVMLTGNIVNDNNILCMQ
jgi:hypothetical protein